MRLRLTSGLAMAFIAAVAAVFLILGIALTSYVGRRNDDLALARLRQQAALAADAAYGIVSESNAADAARLVEEIHSDIGTDAIIYAAGGAPLADSSAPVSSTQNQPQTPELGTALQGTISTDLRDDPTTGRPTWYAAAPVERNGRVIGAVTLSIPADELTGPLSNEPGVIVLFLITAGLATLLVILVVTRIASRPLTKIEAATQRLSLGDLSARAPEEGGGDFVNLAIAFNEMADELQATFDTIELERRRLDSIVEHLGDGIVIVDDEGNIALMNRATERLLGVRRDRAIGRSYAQVFRDYELVGVVRDAQATPGPRSLPGERFIELGRPRRAVQTFAYPIPSDDAPLVLVVLRDITEFRRTEAVRRDFVANVSHDLRTPIASLKALVETLLDGALEDENVAREFLNRMQVEVDDLARLVEELLQLSRAEAGQIELHLAPGSLETVTRRVAERMRAQASMKQITIRVEIPAELAPAMFDADRIEQVLVNLVHNAIKFTPKGGDVSIRVSEENGEVMVAIQDSGPGLDHGDLDRVFERFYKADRSRSAAGSGLGLAIAKHLVQLHGGRIWAESEYGRGATFKFALPRATDSDIEREESIRSSASTTEFPFAG